MSPKIYYSISDDIFRLYPGYLRGVVVAHGVHNGAAPAELAGMLKAEEQALRLRLPFQAEFAV